MTCPSCGNVNRAEARFCDSCGRPLGGEPAARQRSETQPPDRVPAPGPHAPESVGAGRFRIEGFLGRGSRKEVFLARDMSSAGEPVAVSVFSTEGMGAATQARARREADAMARLGRHPRVVGVLASGEDEGTPYIVSEYMPGGTLEALLADHDGGCGVERALELATDIAAGLAHAHGVGIVHRDVKPANVWLDADGRARIGDFGLAVTDLRSREAVEGMMVGTAAYLPPEQAIGRRSDQRADLYSLGALVYELLTGEPPFPGDDPVTIIAGHLGAEPLPPSRRNPDVSAGLDELVVALLAKAPEQRPASAAAVLSALRRLEADPGPGADGEPTNPLDRLAGGVFVGRDRELDELKDVLEPALAGRGGAILVEGEPGIGKSRLVEELVTYARVRGAQTLSAACHEADGMPAYWPFARAIRGYIREADPVGLAWQLGSDGPELARLVPELRERVPAIGPAEPIEDEAARFRFYEAVAAFLAGLARSRPLLLALDDLHWADSSSIELLSFLSRRIAGEPLLLVAAYRDEEAARREALRRTLSEIDEIPNHRRLALEGLGLEAIGRYVELTAGVRPDDALLAQIHEQTGGNPFFVGELVRLIAVEGGGLERGRLDLGEIPSGVRGAVARRVGRLDAATRETLHAAAVLGRRFEQPVLEAMLGRPAGAALREAAGARILGERGSERWAFSHAVFQEALGESLDPDRCAELHRLAGEAIEELFPAEIEARLPALARHFGQASSPSCDGKAFAYALRAARQAAGRLAHADAAEYLATALTLLRRGAGEGHSEVALRLELGEELTRSGGFNEARVVLERAALLAREQGDAESLATAAIKLGALAVVGTFDRLVVGLCEDALEALGERSPGKRARLLTALSQQHYWLGPQGTAVELGERAIALARECGDDAALAEALAGRQFVDSAKPGSAEQRIANVEELLAAARRAGDRDSEVRGLAFRLTALLQLGETTAADRTQAEYEALAAQLGEPRHLWHVPITRATRALLRGEFDRAEELSAEGLRLGRLAEEPLSEQFHAIQMSQLHTFRGTVEEMLPEVRRMVARYPAIPAWRLTLVNFLVEAGRSEEARTEFEPIAAAGFEELPPDANWLIGIVNIAEAAVWLGDTGSCELLLERLEPFAGEIVVVGRAALSRGPVDRSLGLLAGACGRHADAVAHLERALAVCERAGDRPFAADVRLQLGRALLRRDEGEDRERALEVLGEALEEAGELGMRRVLERTVRARLEAQGLTEVDVLASIEGIASEVAGGRPDMLAAAAAADGRVTLMFSDIENSTLLTERLGDRAWLEALRRHNEVFRRHLGEYGGYEVKNQGDGFMLAFPDPGRALECAVAVQRELAESAEAGGAPIRVRIGMHVGTAIVEDGDFFGRSVILAARIAAQARSGEILVSEDLHAAVPELAWDEDRELELKGLAGTHRVFRAVWAGESAGAARL
jgi:eukaryotic-like serine/threonine-protein kinase